MEKEKVTFEQVVVGTFLNYSDSFSSKELVAITSSLARLKNVEVIDTPFTKTKLYIHHNGEFIKYKDNYNLESIIKINDINITLKEYFESLEPNIVKEYFNNEFFDVKRALETFKINNKNHKR